MKRLITGLLLLVSFSAIGSPVPFAFFKTASGGDVTAPTLSSATIGTNGVTWTLVFNETVSIGSGGSGGWAVTMSTAGAETLTYSSGSGSNTLVYTGSPTVISAETVSSGLNYTQPGNGIEDLAGNDLATLTSAGVTNNSTQSAITYLINQGFEGTGYDNGETWTEPAGTPDEDYTATVLSGSQSLQINGSDEADSPSFASQTTIEVYALLRFTTLPSASTSIFFIKDSGGTRCRFKVNGSGQVIINATGTDGTATVSTMILNTTYRVWMRYVSGGTCTAAFTPFVDGTDVRPTSGNNFTSQTGGSGSVTGLIVVEGSTDAFIIDTIKVLNGSIGSTP